MSVHVNLFAEITFWVFAAVTTLHIFYYLWFYLAPAIHRSVHENNEPGPVSVIICARNEAENLDRFLPVILEQKYSDYEVIVVNDCSEDNTFDILGKYLLRYPHLRVSTINKDPKFTHNKKLAQFIGIKAAKNELLLFTDADCMPESDNWIRSMAGHFGNDTTFVLGYGGYFREKGLLNSYIRYDSMVIAMQYLGMAIRGIPYMGVGRNLAYRRSFFFANKGYGAHNQLASGDDDLIVNANATRANTKVEFSSKAHTRSVPAKNFTDYIKQKRRHFTTAPHYKPLHKILLLGEPVSRVLHYASLTVLLSAGSMVPFAAGIAGIRLLVYFTTIILVSRRLKEPGIAYLSIFFDIFSPLIQSMLYIAKDRRKQSRSIWK